MSSAAAEIPRRAVVRLARLGFEDGERAAVLLSDPALGLWDLERNEPADPEAGPVIAALARAGDPDLALRSLHRLVEALDGRDSTGGHAAALLAHLRGSGLLRSRLLAVLGASSGLADHLAAHPADWTALEDDGEGIFRGSTGPSAQELQRRLLAAVGADPDDPPWGVRLGKAAPDASPDRVTGLRLAYRRAVLSLAGRDLGDGLSADDVAAELADIAAAVLTAGLAIAVAEQPASAAACRLAVIGLGKCGGRELNYVSDVVGGERVAEIAPGQRQHGAAVGQTQAGDAVGRRVGGGLAQAHAPRRVVGVGADRGEHPALELARGRPLAAARHAVLVLVEHGPVVGVGRQVVREAGAGAQHREQPGPQQRRAGGLPPGGPARVGAAALAAARRARGELGARRPPCRPPR